jgi:hypothetical protein
MGAGVLAQVVGAKQEDSPDQSVHHGAATLMGEGVLRTPDGAPGLGDLARRRSTREGEQLQVQVGEGDASTGASPLAFSGMGSLICPCV